jgi:hypothetical protein
MNAYLGESNLGDFDAERSYTGSAPPHLPSPPHESEQLRPGSLPSSVEIKFDHMNETVWIDCCTVDFYGKNHRRIIRRILPLIQSWANTIHKFQGTTVNKCVIDLGTELLAKGMAYVAISRVRTLNGLAITNLDVSKLIRTSKFSPANDEAIMEMERLRNENLDVKMRKLVVIHISLLMAIVTLFNYWLFISILHYSKSN